MSQRPYSYLTPGVIHKGHERQSEVFSPEYETRVPKVEFKMILRSVDRINTDNTSLCVFNIQTQRICSREMKVHLNSIVFNNSSSGNSLNSARTVHIKEIVNKSSFSTARNGPTTIIGLVQGYSLISDVYCNTYIDSSVLSNNQLSVYFNDINTASDPTGATAIAVDPWVMEISLIEI